MTIKNISRIKLVYIAVGFALLLISLTPQAATTSWKSPSENSGDFQNPDGAYSDGQASATARPSEQHQYWGYTFNLPSNSTIEGIEIRLDGQKSASSFAWFKVELSWNGGSNWTDGLQTDALVDQEERRILGGAKIPWGHDWNRSELSQTKFRVRITSLGDGGSSLDWIPVRIYYKVQGRTLTTVAKSTMATSQAAGYCSPTIFSSYYEEIENTTWNISITNDKIKNLTVEINIKGKGVGCEFYSKKEYIRVWIDFDGDQQFSTHSSDQELVLKDKSNNNDWPTDCDGTMTFTKNNINIPNDAVPFTYLRTALAYDTEPNPCGKWDWGDYQDYQISLPTVDYSVTDNLDNLTINQTDLDQWFGDPEQIQQSLGDFGVTIECGSGYQVSACYQVDPDPTPTFSGKPLKVTAPNNDTNIRLPKCPSSSTLSSFGSGTSGDEETITYPTEIDLSKLGDRKSGETFTFTIDIVVTENP